ncbi:Cytochrome P450 94A2 [Camellia lanceoleosa]|uniref:Cytochrome P450 94A2 n=1 Tax=Camellia lanceoleosa TaxID=1840588 RepID=A0ACC0F354_9ERIC|nr:Cytochrome P450 94A2 [Camellia lanceoleosa]
MVYTHASLSETMRLYPPIPIDGKQALKNNVLPDGTVVKKGMRVNYHPYALGRSEELWGEDWAEFRPERWLERDDDAAAEWRFLARDPYAYPVFQAGPRVCIGKEMAFLQMKRVVGAVLRRFQIVPAFEEAGVNLDVFTAVSSLAYRSLKEGDQAMVSHGGGAVSAEDSKGSGWPPGPSACTYIGGSNYSGGGGCHRG